MAACDLIQSVCPISTLSRTHTKTSAAESTFAAADAALLPSLAPHRIGMTSDGVKFIKTRNAVSHR